MPQCKISGCREPALPTGKRYCAAHRAAYDAKQRAYAATAATLRCCEGCGERLTKTSHDRGDRYCRSCTLHFERAERVAELHRDLDRCETVAELRGFIRLVLLPLVNVE